MDDLYTFKKIRTNPVAQGFQGVEVYLNLDFARRAKNFNISSYQRKLFVQNSIQVINSFYPETINIDNTMALRFHRTGYDANSSWSGLLYQSAFPRTTSRKAYSLGIVLNDWESLNKSHFRNPVRYRSFGTSNDSQIENLLELFEKGWLLKMKEILRE